MNVRVLSSKDLPAHPLRALAVALGGARADVDDLTVGKETAATIDVFIAPRPRNKKRGEESDKEIGSENFDQRLTEIIDAGLQQISLSPSKQRFAWRTTLELSSEGLGPRTDRDVLTFTSDGGSWSLGDRPRPSTRQQLAIVTAIWVSGQRDMDQELGRPGSAIRRILSDLDINEDVRSVLQRDLADLNSRIVDGSATLADMRIALERLTQHIGSIGQPSLNPVPSRLEELARSVVVEMDTGSGPLPARLHGSGTKSLASLQLQGVLYKRRLGRDGAPPRPQPLTLIEEPEAHLHPQAVFELPTLMGSLSGQVVASTHSSHLVSATDPCSIRILRPEGTATRVVDIRPVEAGTEDEETPRALRGCAGRSLLDRTRTFTVDEIAAPTRSFRRESRTRPIYRGDHSPLPAHPLSPKLYVDEMEKLKRQVERPFGDLLFASAIVIGDGATERAFLPVMLRHALGSKADGVSVVDPGSMGTPFAQAVIKFARLAHIPWFLFADSDDDGCEAATRLVEQHGGRDVDHIVWVGGGSSSQGKQPGTGAEAIEAMLMDWDEMLCRETCLHIRPDRGNYDTGRLLRSLKGSSGSHLAYAFTKHYPDHTIWPAPLQDLVKLLKKALSNSREG